MNEIKPYSKAIVYLLRKTAEKSSPVWNDILLYQSEIQEYLSVIGLELIVKKDEGFVSLRLYGKMFLPSLLCVTLGISKCI